MGKLIALFSVWSDRNYLVSEKVSISKQVLSRNYNVRILVTRV